jgi:hypothetical protein
LPVEFEIDHQDRLVTATAHGVVVLQEILDYFDAISIHDAASYAKLFDARQMVPQLSDDDVMVLAARISAYAAFDPRGPVAAVAATAEARDIVRRYMNFGGANRPMRLFTSVDKARAWLLGQLPA